MSPEYLKTPQVWQRHHHHCRSVQNVFQPLCGYCERNEKQIHITLQSCWLNASSCCQTQIQVGPNFQTSKSQANVDIHWENANKFCFDRINEMELLNQIYNRKQTINSNKFKQKKNPLFSLKLSDFNFNSNNQLANDNNILQYMCNHSSPKP